VGAELEQSAEGLVVGAAVSGFVTARKEQGFRLVGQGPEGQGEAAGMVDFLIFGVDLFCLAVHFEVKKGGFVGPIAALAPFRYDHFVDQVALDVVGRLEFFVVSGCEFLVGFGVFIRKQDGFGRQAVTESVLAGDRFPLRGFGALDLAPLRRAASICACVGIKIPFLSHRSGDLCYGEQVCAPVHKIIQAILSRGGNFSKLWQKKAELVARFSSPAIFEVVARAGFGGCACYL
jgi:hypothetical protein